MTAAKALFLVIIIRLMGYNTTALFIANRTPEAVLEYATDVYEYGATGDMVDVQDAHSRLERDCAYTAVVGGWAHVWNPSGNVVNRVLADVGNHPGPLAGTSALAVDFSSVTGMYGFTLYEDGRIVRQLVYNGLEVTEDVGVPLAAESRFRQRRAKQLELSTVDETDQESDYEPDPTLTPEQRERQRILLGDLEDVPEHIQPDYEEIIWDVIDDVVGSVPENQPHRVWAERLRGASV